MNLRYSTFQKCLQALCILCLLGTMVYLAAVWGQLPARIPTHFNAYGQPNAWGGRLFLLFFPIVSVLLFAGLTVVERFPHRWNSPVKITERNRAAVYQGLRTMLLLVKLEMLAMFFYLSVAQTRAPPPGVVFFLLGAGAPVATCIACSVRLAFLPK